MGKICGPWQIVITGLAVSTVAIWGAWQLGAVLANAHLWPTGPRTNIAARLVRYGDIELALPVRWRSDQQNGLIRWLSTEDSLCYSSLRAVETKASWTADSLADAERYLRVDKERLKCFDIKRVPDSKLIYYKPIEKGVDGIIAERVLVIMKGKHYEVRTHYRYNTLIEKRRGAELWMIICWMHPANVVDDHGGVSV